jgi:hypothetical protein
MTTISTTPTISPDEPVFDSHRILTDPLDLDDRVRQLIPCGIRRRLWVILLDADDTQIPAMIPIGDLPTRRRAADAEGLIETLSLLDGDIGAARYVFVVERPGSSRLREDDLLWLQFLTDVGDEHGFDIRAVYLSHDTGTVRYTADESR